MKRAKNIFKGIIAENSPKKDVNIQVQEGQGSPIISNLNKPIS